ncbi:uncharacterized protein N7484_001222 [Penicillium longicatenatum]|uniref:uncharacterized protein n=1 Tax=Penicillium longicatenatum TaxID=1561947 RepID=UPI0025493201|nr:uncharacterized protein N7484_001222 [Penicillium longicatenatum]KAJ5657573.1 hypothetical protein N7484_001222 [Penicillium longicatenatum]
MADDDLPRGEVVGIIIGAVALFSLISFFPMVLMWQHRRRDASRRASETANLTSSMQQVSVTRWIEEQNEPSENARYAQDMCPICLSSLSSPAYLSSPEPAHLPGIRSDDASIPDTENEKSIIVLNRCHHAFHSSCLTSWFEYRHYKCPICQASYSPVESV